MEFSFLKIIILVVFIYYAYHHIKEYSAHYDYSKVNYVKSMEYFAPKNINELQRFLRRNKRPFCIIGAGFSHGGHTLCENGTQISMQNINHVHFNKNTEILTVGSGANWHNVIKYLVQFEKTPAVMQSYFNFSVGGSISVNCHGRDVRFGSISNTIHSLKIITSNGDLLECSHKRRADLFRGTIGGYGLLGIIVEAKLIVAPNEKIKLKIIESDRIECDKNAVFYNGTIYPTQNIIHNNIWVPTNDKLTNEELTRPMNEFPFNLLKMIGEQVLRLSNIAKYLRGIFEPTVLVGSVHYKSFEIGDDAMVLQPFSKHPNTSVLQEYFVPIDNIYIFLEKLMDQIYELNIINISIRFNRAIKDSILNYSPVDTFSVVLYFAVGNNSFSLAKLTRWTDKMLTFALSVGGRFYLPYLRTYSNKLIKQMYRDELDDMMALKQKYDPENRIQNQWSSLFI